MGKDRKILSRETSKIKNNETSAGNISEKKEKENEIIDDLGKDMATKIAKAIKGEKEEKNKIKFPISLLVNEGICIPELTKNIPSGTYICKTKAEYDILKKYIGGLE